MAPDRRSIVPERLRVIGREGNLTFRALRTSRLSMAGLFILLALAVVALLAPVIASQHPAYVDVNGQIQQRWTFHNTCPLAYQDAPPTPPILIGETNVTTYTGEALGFTAVASDPDLPANLLTWTWNWGDLSSNITGGTPDTTNSADHVWSAPGLYRVTLTVSDGFGNAASRNSANVTVEAAPIGLGTIRGAVTSNTSASVIAGAQVFASPGGFAAITASNGTYSISAPAGTYSLTTQAWLFSSRSTSAVSVSANSTTTVDVALGPDVGWIVGNVNSSDGNRIARARVTATGATGLQVAIGGNALGAYNLSVPSGTYSINATDAQNRYHSGFAANITIPSGRAVEVPFSLPPITFDCQILLAPSLAHPFGTDELGVDLMSKAVHAAQIDIILPFEVMIPSAAIGIVIGGIAGYFEHAFGEILMRVTDVFLAVPSIVLALTLAAALGPSLDHIVLAMIATWWAWYARLIYGETRKMKHRDFVEVARSSGLSGSSIFFRHIMSNVLSPAIIQATADLGSVLLSVAALCFLGLGPDVNTAEWGVIIERSLYYLFTAWWYPVFPGIFLITTALAFNLLGDGLRDVFDPTSRRWLSQAARHLPEVKHRESPGPMAPNALLKVDDLSITYRTYEGPVHAVRNVSFELNRGEAYGLIGESGSGKSTVALGIMGLLPPQSTQVSSGDVFFVRDRANDGGFTNLLLLKEDEMNAVRGKDIAMIFQEVSDSLHPAYRVGYQMGQMYLLHQFELILELAAAQVEGTLVERPCDYCGATVKLGDWICEHCRSVVEPLKEKRHSLADPVPKSFTGSQRGDLMKYRELFLTYSKRSLGPDRPPDKRTRDICRTLAVRDLRRALVPDPERTVDLYPFELSGGMKQRAMIGMMMASNPKLLIADEPTTALDVVTERNILDLIKKFKEELGVSVLLISHDLSVIRRFCDRVGVIYAGKLVEEGPLDQVFSDPWHPYTSGLIKSLPKVRSGGAFVPKGEYYTMQGSLPELKAIPKGCVFAPRCARATEECLRTDPPLEPLAPGRTAACFHPLKEEVGHGG
jgi:peptide/nickel transport system permease protein